MPRSIQVHSTTKYCTPVWCNSAHKCLINPAINDAVQIVTGCLRPTPAVNLSILAGIQPAELHHKGATLSLACRVVEPGHLLHSALTYPLSVNTHSLKLRHPIIPTAQLISSSDNNILAALWVDHLQNAEWLDNPARLLTVIANAGTHRPGMTLPRTAWVWLNHLVTSVRRFHFCLHKWVMASSAASECGTEEQTVDHFILQCPLPNPSTSPMGCIADGSGR